MLLLLLNFFGELLADLLIEQGVLQVLLLLIGSVRFVPMYAQLAPLLESLVATVNPTDIGVLVCMGEFMFLQILGQGELLVAVFALIFLLLVVNQHVSFERVLGAEYSLAFVEVADELLLRTLPG